MKTERGRRRVVTPGWFSQPYKYDALRRAVTALIGQQSEVTCTARAPKGRFSAEAGLLNFE